MTSSLVGSEMCIRDSSSTFRRVHPEYGGLLFFQPSVSACSAAATIVSEACLLYTSDAADDM
eukprot:8326202-Prorocentrum_lima.AAC.1